MYCHMAFALQCLNINCWITSPHQSLFATLWASLVLFSFTARSSLTLKSMPSRFKKSCSMSTRCMLVISGPPQPQPHLMNYAIAFFAILAFIVLITESSPSSGQTFCPKAFTTLFSTLMMTMHPCNWLSNTCLDMDLVSWPQQVRAHSISLPLDLGKHVVMNHTSICTLVNLPETGLWVNVTTCCLGIASFGSRTVTLLSFFSCTMVAIKKSSIFKCVLWDGLSTLLIRQMTI